MIGSGLKKYAQKNGMNVAHGVAYGSLKGYAATLSEGSGYKQIVVATKFTDPAKPQELQTVLNQKNISREYRVQNITFHADGIGIVFTDNPGTMKKIEAFVDWFLPMLPEYSALPANICSECGSQLTSVCWKLVDGIAYPLHESCAEKVRQALEAENETRKEAATGSYGTGLLGALLGSALGAIVWAVVLNMGYLASVVGLLIGWLAEKGYNLLKGKQGKAKVAILIIAIILGVVGGTLGADAWTVGTMIAAGELPGLAYGDIPLYIVALFAEVPEYGTSVAQNILTGLIFAALGVFALLRKAGKEVADSKMVDLP